MMTHHFVMTSSLLIKILKIDKFGDFSSEIYFKTKMDIFRDYISLIINQCHPQATEGSLPRTRSVRQPRSASKRSALVSLNKALQWWYKNMNISLLLKLDYCVCVYISVTN